MKTPEKGYALIELLIAVTIMAIASTAAGAAIFQIFHNIGNNSDQLNASRQLQNAGYRVSRDAQVAESATTDNLTFPEFLILNWTEWDDDLEPIYHSATYFFDGLSNNIGKLKRTHWSSGGANEETLVAVNIYFYPGDNATSASYQDQLLTVQLTAVSDDIQETRRYLVRRRTNY